MEVPDIQKFLSPTTGELIRSIPTTSRMYHLFYDGEYNVRKDFLDKDGKTVLTFYTDDGVTIRSDCVNEDGTFIAFVNADGDHILHDFAVPESPISSSTTSNNAEVAIHALLQQMAQSNMTQTTIMQTLADNSTKVRTSDGMQNLTKWDGNAKSWYAWKKSAESRWRRLGIMPAPGMDIKEEQTLYDEIKSHLKIDSSAESRQLQVHLQENEPMGSKVWETFVREYEKHNVRIRKSLRTQLKAVTIKSHVHDKYKNLYDVTDMFNNIKLLKLQLTEAGGKWEDDTYLEMLDEAFNHTSLFEQYSDLKVRLEIAGTPITVDVLETYMCKRSDAKIMEADQKKPSESRTPGIVAAFGDGETPTVCKDCGSKQHMSKNNPKCPKHVAKPGDDSRTVRDKPASSDRVKATLPWTKLAKEHPKDFQDPLPGPGFCWGCGKKDVFNVEQCETPKCKVLVKKYKQEAAKRVPGEVRVTEETEDPPTDANADAPVKRSVRFKAHGVGMSFEDQPLVYSVDGTEMSRNDARRRLLKLDSCGNRDYSPYIEDFISMRLVEPGERDGVEGMWGEEHTPTYIGDTLYWIDDVDGNPVPLKCSDTVFDPKANARVVSAIGTMVARGWILDMTNSKTATLPEFDEFGDVVLPIQHINDITQFITNSCPSGEDFSMYHGKALHRLPTPLANLTASYGTVYNSAGVVHPPRGSVPPGEVRALTSRQSTKTLWHLRMGHAESRTMDKTRSHPGTSGLDWNKDDTLAVCHSCPAGKAKAQPVSKNTNVDRSKITKGSRWCSDTSGKLSVPSLQGAKYTHTMVDFHTSKTIVTGLKTKPQITPVIAHALDNVAVGVNASIVVKELMCDGDRSNYKTAKFDKMLSDRGVKKLYTPEYKAAFNGKVERMQGVLDTMAQAMLHYAKLDYTWYVLAYRHSSWIHDRLATIALDWDIPEWLWSGKTIIYKFLRIFGCPAFVTIPFPLRTKHQTKSWTGVYVGVANNEHAYRIVNPFTLKEVERIDVTFDEHWIADASRPTVPLTPPAREQVVVSSSDEEDDLPEVVDPYHAMYDDDDLDLDSSDDEPQDRDLDGLIGSDAEQDDVHPQHLNAHALTFEPSTPNHPVDMPALTSGAGYRTVTQEDLPELGAEHGCDTTITQDPMDATEVSDTTVRDSARSSSRLRDNGSSSMSYKGCFTTESPSPHQAKSKATSANRKIQDDLVKKEIEGALGTYGVVNYVAYSKRYDLEKFYHENDEFERNYAQVLYSETGEVTPKCRKQALNIDRLRGNNSWQKSMDKEHAALEKRGTWKKVPISQVPKGKKILRSIWALKVKHGENGEWTDDKSRGCADGRGQVYGDDYNESYSPTCKTGTARMALSTEVADGGSSLHVDIDNAFLYGFIEDGVEIYMYCLEGYETYTADGELEVCLLVKGLYGLVQAALLFNNELVDEFVDLGFKQCVKDPGLFVKKIDPGIHIKIPIHVDDLMISGHPHSALVDCQDQLGKRFSIKKLGACTWYTGIKITRGPGWLHIGQQAYVDKLVSKYNMTHATPQSIPLLSGVDVMSITKDPEWHSYDSSLADSTAVRGIVGGIAWATDCTRLDMAGARLEFARVQNACPQSVFNIMKDSLRYMNDTADLGIAYFRDCSKKNILIAYCDTDFAGCRITSKSRYMMILFLNGGPVYWKVRFLEGKPSGSTTEAETGAHYLCFNEVLYHRALLEEMGYPQSNPTTMYVDNNCALTLATTGRITPRNRHFDTKWNNLKWGNDNGVIKSVYTGTKTNLADLGTKSHQDVQQFRMLRDRMMHRVADLPHWPDQPD